MNSLHSLRTECRSEWQMPQNRISICISRSIGSRRLIFVDASPDVSLAAEYAFALYVVGCMLELVTLNSNRNPMSRRAYLSGCPSRTRQKQRRKERLSSRLCSLCFLLFHSGTITTA